MRKAHNKNIHCGRRAVIYGAAAALALVALPPPVRAGEPVTEFIERLADNAIQKLSGGDITAAQREERFRELLHENFDVIRISRFALGKYVRRIKPDQMKTFTALFEEMTVLTYADMFAAYSGQKFKVKKSVGAPGDRYAMVMSEIQMPNGGQPVRLDWQVHVAKDDYAVVDIRVEGVSMALAQRAEFTSFLDKNKGNMNVFLDALRERIEARRKKKNST